MFEGEVKERGLTATESESESKEGMSMFAEAYETGGARCGVGGVAAPHDYYFLANFGYNL